MPAWRAFKVPVAPHVGAAGEQRHGVARRAVDHRQQGPRGQRRDETKPDGNNVTLEDQLLKMGQVQTDFTPMTNLYRKQMTLIQAAIGHQ